MQMMMVGLPLQGGETALEALDDLRSDKEVKLEDLALIYRNKNGRVKVKQTSDTGIGKGLVRGGVLGLLVGIVFPVGAVATAVAGGALGGIIAAFDDGIDNAMMKKLGSHLDMHESVLVALGEESDIKKLEDGFAPYMDGLTMEIVPEATHKMIKELSKLSADDLAGL
jgi:uncharacterized membrane protein